MKKVGLLLILCLATLTASAQESGISAEAGRKTTFVKNGFWDNWFLGAGASASIYVGPGDQHADILNRLTVTPTLFVGKWFNPYWGGRLTLQSGSIHTFSGGDAQVMHSMKEIGAHVDVMFNVTNYLCNYNSKRFYNFILNGGVGVTQVRNGGYDASISSYPVTFHFGLLNTFRLSDRVSAFVELGGDLVEKKFDTNHANEVIKDQPHGWRPIGRATAGLTLKLGGKDFTEAVLADQAQIDGLNAEINRLRAENAELSKRPKSCPEQKPCPQVKTPAPVETSSTYVPNVVFFRIGSAAIDKNQEVSIFNTAEYLKANPSSKVKVVGYADKKTGTAKFNDKLSEKRAKTVAKTLVDKYGISNDRVSVEWKGSAEQPYKVNEWNRVAIFFAD
ncbi:OOP family OmpA-OmpF porin [Dysgonomonas sp. PH5-45]|uniref:OmpA family protein n=1 Tax=unclassified Dysgonomonas TaxID=2630389 RepID=UPI002475DACB|nr:MULTISPECIES: OmpA family protein [unclassified Dysgonomonas]MDH6355432.1 OOP family OmpA-OmpF porin [Dysgonomonas sp. PH5-45]MDH6388329.1 OOP family OmpA-OmpF porin [Dysgonomonas sp. PH5-37]